MKKNPFKLSSTEVNSTDQLEREVKKEVSPEVEIKKDIRGMFTKKEKEKKFITTIYINESLSQKLNKVAKEHDISVNEVVTTILEKTL